jgi:molybdenum cofactor cytidylyltransferase
VRHALPARRHLHALGAIVQLGDALGIRAGEIVALVGAGGKTATLQRLASESLAQGWRVIATTTTHVLPPPLDEGWPLIVERDARVRSQAVLRAVKERGRAFVAGITEPDGKLAGIPPGEVEGLLPLADVVLVEADGARGRWLKAPAEHEPVIPPAAGLVVPVVGLQAVGQPLDGQVVHRPQHFAALLQSPPGSVISEHLVARLLQHSAGGLQGVPPQARVVAFCNHADSPDRRVAGRRVAAAVLQARGRIACVVVGAAQTPLPDCERWEPAAVVILAAGAGRRYGRLKQAEVWDGRPFLSRVVAAALSSLAAEVHVVLGYRAEALEPLLREQGSTRLQHTVNPAWEEGLARSVQAGLQAVGPAVQAALFCHADQPLLTAAEIDALLVRRALTGAPIVAPCWQGEFHSPILFGRALFADLVAHTGDTGGRGLLDCYPHLVEAVEIPDPLPYEDVDTPADYLRLRRLGGDGRER